MDTSRENILWNNFRGQTNSFCPLFDYFYQSLCEYAFQIVGDGMDAEDVRVRKLLHLTIKRNFVFTLKF